MWRKWNFLTRFHTGLSYHKGINGTVTGLLIAFPVHHAVEQTTKRGLKHVLAAYGRLWVTETDKGTHFMEHELQEWAQQLGIR